MEGDLWVGFELIGIATVEAANVAELDEGVLPSSKGTIIPPDEADVTE